MASEATLAMLNQDHTYLYLDGTFKVAPQHFCQLWIICGHVLESTEATPLAYFLLEDKSTPSYSKCLEILVRNCPRLSVDTVVCDFEVAEHNATKTHLPGADIQGCLFHFKQALRKRFIKLTEFHKDPALKAELQTLYGLAFVPEADVPAAWEVLKGRVTHPSAAPVLQYFEETWIKSSTFPINMWNVYDAVLTGGPRTNNYSEGNNNSLSRAIGCSNPSGELLAKGLTKFNETAELHIEHCLTGVSTTTKKRKVYKENDERIRRAVDNYGRVGVAMFCRSLSRLV